MDLMQTANLFATLLRNSQSEYWPAWAKSTHASLSNLQEDRNQEPELEVGYGSIRWKSIKAQNLISTVRLFPRTLNAMLAGVIGPQRRTMAKLNLGGSSKNTGSFKMKAKSW